MTVETYTGEGAFGSAYAAPAALACFVDDSDEWKKNGDEGEVVSVTTIYAPPGAAAVLTAQSRVTVGGRAARVISVNVMDGDALGLPSHVVAKLT